ncbi:uroporphyrinogen decarboxylase [Alphaproteobacteria bacterium]|nr:uroporphyrinogen decarboxylase [Alphaproteobacteria bacterium]
MNKLVLDNLNYKTTERVPVWLMRQAGRYMKEYHIVKNKFNNFMEMCKNSEAITEITLQPIKKFDFDAAIIFSDILLILDAIHINVEFISGKGPVVENLESLRNINLLSRELNDEKVKPCYEAINNIKKELIDKPLIGFSAAPWTLATYYIEGNITKDLSRIKSFSYKNSKEMDFIIDLFSDLILQHLLNQIEAGVDLVQIFDTHSFQMDYFMHQKYSIKQIKKIARAVKEKYPNIPIIYYSKNFHFLDAETNNYLNCLSLNSNISLKEQKKYLRGNICLQGNLDPYLLLEGGEYMIKEIKNILSEMESNFFIFNLGHGILPQTPVENVFKLVETVKSFKKKV